MTNKIIKSNGIKTNFSGEMLIGRDFSSSVLDDYTFENSSLEESDFSNSSLKNADLSRARLTGANLANTDLTGANLEGARLTKVNAEKIKGQRVFLVKQSFTDLISDLSYWADLGIWTCEYFQGSLNELEEVLLKKFRNNEEIHNRFKRAIQFILNEANQE